MAGLYKLSEEREMICTMAWEMAKDRLTPRAAEVDREGKFPLGYDRVPPSEPHYGDVCPG